MTAATAFGVSVVVGRIVGGYLLDKFNPGIIGGVLITSMAIAFLILPQSNLSTSMTLLGIALAGFGTGVELDVLSYIVKRLFGQAQYVKAFGAMVAVLYCGSAFGPILFGVTYDRFGNYAPVLFPTAIGVFVSALLIGSLSRSLKPQPRTPA